MQDSPFSYADPDDPLARRALIRFLEAVTGARAMEKLYLRNRVEAQPGEDWWNVSIRTMGIDLRFDPAALDAVPKSGPLIVASNHPFGVVDGIALTALIHRVRRDYRVLTNAVLLRAHEIRDWVLPVSFDETPEALKMNLQSRAAARAHLATGGALVIFPAGAVSTSPDRFGRKPAVDGPWQPIVAQLLEKSRATFVPVNVSGENSRLFQIVSHIHPTLRLALFFHEMRRLVGARIDLRIGAPTAFEALPKFQTRPELAAHLRALSYALRAEPQPRPR